MCTAAFIHDTKSPVDEPVLEGSSHGFLDERGEGVVRVPAGVAGGCRRSRRGRLRQEATPCRDCATGQVGQARGPSGGHHPGLPRKDQGRAGGGPLVSSRRPDHRPADQDRTVGRGRRSDRADRPPGLSEPRRRTHRATGRGQGAAQDHEDRRAQGGHPQDRGRTERRQGEVGRGGGQPRSRQGTPQGRRLGPGGVRRGQGESRRGPGQRGHCRAATRDRQARRAKRGRRGQGGANPGDRRHSASGKERAVGHVFEGPIRGQHLEQIRGGASDGPRPAGDRQDR